eukprot:CAMPEP_0197072404 /NCGR_PEP_ID=MMETSP1384-20130603/210078_1 /TAXON_ID=29189 /ORGANISM="Ammonia sp." /LENGTH=415 /DNA_ID=CAMNT_0042511221 /DNA_START=68 /DNA_END=1315 /DNA_ORIENTATION=-
MSASNSVPAMLMFLLAIVMQSGDAQNDYYNNTYFILTMDNAALASYAGVYVQDRSIAAKQCFDASATKNDGYVGTLFYRQVGSTKFAYADGALSGFGFFWRLVIADAAVPDCVSIENSAYDLLSNEYIPASIGGQWWDDFVNSGITPTFTLAGGATTSTFDICPKSLKATDLTGCTTEMPTSSPSAEPTYEPTSEPTTDPTAEPTTGPTTEPTKEPTSGPTRNPTSSPTSEPTAEPTGEPTASPTTAEPTMVMSTTEMMSPTSEPTAEPTGEPTASPTTAEPTMVMSTTEMMTTDEDDLCDIGQGLAFLSVGTVCEFCLCSDGARGACEAIANAISEGDAFSPNLAALLEAECPTADYVDLQDEEGAQCALSEITLKSDVDSCSCERLTCGLTDGAKQYGVMMAIMGVLMVWCSM